MEPWPEAPRNPGVDYEPPPHTVLVLPPARSQAKCQQVCSQRQQPIQTLLSGSVCLGRMGNFKRRLPHPNLLPRDSYSLCDSTTQHGVDTLPARTEVDGHFESPSGLRSYSPEIEIGLRHQRPRNCFLWQMPSVPHIFPIRASDDLRLSRAAALCSRAFCIFRRRSACWGLSTLEERPWTGGGGGGVGTAAPLSLRGAIL